MLANLEHDVLFFINQHHSNFLDYAMLFASHKFTWIPLYLLLIWLIWKNHKVHFFEILFFIVLIIFISDQVSVLFKNYFQRLRPCNDPSLAHLLRMIDGCGGLYGFVSSHAANSMALAVFIGTLLKRYRWILLMLIFYTFITGYSRIYLAAHFAGDVLGGFTLGGIIALLLLLIFRYRHKEYMRLM
jgi:undecaprenyl-diphosphatase